MKDYYNVNIKCAFCKSEIFELPYEGYQPELYEMIKCSNCGAVNYFESIRKVAIKKTLNVIENDYQNEILNMLKKSGFTVS